MNGLFIISTNPADAQYSNLVVGCGAEFLIVENPTADEFNAILRRVPRLVPTIVCLFVDEFSNLDTRSSAMEHYQAGMFYLSAAQLASAIFSNIVPVLTGGPPRQRSNLSQRFNTQCTQSQTIVSRKPPTVTQETSGSNRPNSSASNFHTLSMDPPTYPLRGSESIGTICGERLPDKITKSQEDDVDLSSPTTPPAVSCTNDHHQHLMKNKVSGAAENVEKSAYTKKLSDDVHSPSMKKLKKRNCSAYEEPFATPIQSKDASLHSTNRSNVIEKNIHASFKTEDSKSMCSPGNDETSVNKEKSVDRKKENFVNKILIQGEDHTVNENVSDEKSKSRDYVDNSNDSDGMFFEERISLKRKQDTLVEDNSDDWVHAAKDADRHELLKCKRTKYKLEYGNISADDISASQAVEVKLEAVVIMKMMIIKRNVDPSGQYKDSGRRLSRDVRRFRKNSIRVVNTESVMSARFMDAVLPKVQEL